MSRRLIAPVLIALALAAGCGSTAPPAAAPAAAGKTVDAATAGTLSGKVLFKGTPPARETFKMGTDTVCLQNAGPNPQSDAILVADGAIQNVFVYIKDGVDKAYTFDVPTTPVTLDQKGCIYTPRVIGVRAGQPIEVINSDATLHNVHALPKANQEFNHPQSKVAEKMTKVFTVPEVMVRFKCDVHGWMSAYVGVMANPYFAVTGADGSFTIAGLPPGTYTVEAWHEKLGTQTTKVTIAERQTQTASFTFEEAKKRP